MIMLMVVVMRTGQTMYRL